MLRFLSIFTLMLSLTACGGGDNKTTSNQPPLKVETTSPTNNVETTIPANKIEPTLPPVKVDPAKPPQKTEPTQVASPKTAPSQTMTTIQSSMLCPQGFSCDMLSVPKDYADTSAGNVNVYYGVHKATDIKNRKGVLMMNFGGPGAETVQQAGLMVTSFFPKTITEHFDIVAMDTRGSGYSVFADQLSGCTAKNNCSTLLPKIAPFMGTNIVVKDIDKLRQKLNEDSISFLGYSYGVEIGAIYAHDYPKHVRALVLDGPIDPSGQNYAQAVLGQTAGADKIASYRLKTAARKAAVIKLDKYFRTHDTYEYYDDGSHGYPAGKYHVTKLQMEVVEEALSGNETRAKWSNVKDDFFDIIDHHQQAKNLQFSYLDKNSDAIESQRMSLMFKTVICRDEKQPLSENDFSLMTDKFTAASDLYGWRYQQHAHMCVDTGIKNDPTPDITHMNQVLPASLQVLVIAGKYDPNTPYAWSNEIMKSFGGSASRITVDHLVRHTFSFSNDFRLKKVDQLTSAYLLNPQDRISDTYVDYLAGNAVANASALSQINNTQQVVHPAQQVTNTLNNMNNQF